MYTIKTATLEDIPAIQSIAEKTWWPTYSELLSADQIAYMLDKIYSGEALAYVIKEKSQEFILLSDVEGPQGFAAFGPRKENPIVFKLHKLYVSPENHGKGYGRILIEEIKSRLTDLGISTLDLNVKRDNPAKTFYEKIGFSIIGEEDIPLGPYVLNDYVMRLEFGN
jgi:ribosomal protein S18 acetylase RimI-like enzyme